MNPPNPRLAGFALRLRRARKDADLSQRELAAKVSSIDYFDQPLTVSSSYLSLLENAQRFPSVDLVFAIADALDVDREWLLTGRGIGRKV